MSRLHYRRAASISGALLLAVFAYAGSCQAGSQVAIDRCPRWDTDCDSISNAVEIDPPNSMYHFDTTRKDANPSIAFGAPDNGSLAGGLNLPEYNEGYYQYRPSSDPRWDGYLGSMPDSNDWGTLAAINAIEATARAWVDPVPTTNICSRYSSEYGGTPRSHQFDIGDISKLGGGPWLNSDGRTRHKSHQNGLDIDVRYPRKDGQNLPLDVRTDPAHYDTSSTADLMTCFINKSNVDLIFADSASIGIWGGALVNDTGHHTHFHVRIHHP